MNTTQSRAVWLWSTVAVMLVALWQTATVVANFEGNWTALFCTGDRMPVPPSLAKGTYLFPGSTGYDGQWYRYIAHDPLGRGEMHSYVDAPPLRYRRILVSGLAAILAFGRQDSIDFVYICVTLAFILAGCYWCSQWAQQHGEQPAWGLLFVVVPATLITIDRMTVDVALAALAAGAAVYWDEKRLFRCYACLAAACLARETGVLILAGWLLVLLFQRQWRTTAFYMTAIVPAAGWFLYLRGALPTASREQSIPQWLFRWDSGIVGRMLDPVRYGFSQPLETVVRIVDSIAIAGMITVLIISGLVVARRKMYPPAVAAALHVGLFAIVNTKGFWDTVYGYARPFSPMIVLAAMSLPCSPKLRFALLAGAAAIDLRIFLQMGPQVIGIYKHWLG